MIFSIDDIFYNIISYFNPLDCNRMERTNKIIMRKLYNKRNRVIEISSVDNFCVHGIMDAIELFYENGFVFGKKHINLSIKNNKQDVFMYIYNKMSNEKKIDNLINMCRYACMNGNMSIFKYLERNNPRFRDDLTTFNAACYSGNMEMIKYLNKKYTLLNIIGGDCHNSCSKNNITYEINNDIDLSRIKKRDNFNINGHVKNIIEVLENVILYNKFEVMIYLIKNIEICRKNVLILLFMYKNYNMIEILMRENDVPITYIFLNEVYKKKNESAETRVIFENICIKLEKYEYNRCCSHMLDNNKIKRCSSLAYNTQTVGKDDSCANHPFQALKESVVPARHSLSTISQVSYDCNEYDRNYMCVDHILKFMVDPDNNKIEQIKKCVYCEFKFDKLYRCTKKNTKNGLCEKHKLNDNCIRKYIITQIQYDRVLLEQQMNYFNKIIDIKKKIRKLMYIIKLACNRVFMILYCDRFRDVVRNKILEYKNNMLLSDGDKKSLGYYLEIVKSYENND